jgi:hypothetical protein
MAMPKAADKPSGTVIAVDAAVVQIKGADGKTYQVKVADVIEKNLKTRYAKIFIPPLLISSRSISPRDRHGSVARSVGFVRNWNVLNSGFGSALPTW